MKKYWLIGLVVAFMALGSAGLAVAGPGGHHGHHPGYHHGYHPGHMHYWPPRPVVIVDGGPYYAPPVQYVTPVYAVPNPLPVPYVRVVVP